MKIVIATPFYPPQVGVLATYAEGLQKAFERRGHTVTVVSFGGVRALPPIVRHAAFFFKMFSAVQGGGFVLALDTWSVGMPAYFAARLASVPFLVRIGGDFLWETFIRRTNEQVRFSDFHTQPRRFSLKETMINAFNTVMTRRAHMLFFNSRFQMGTWKDVYGFPPEKARILENVFPARTQEIQPANGRVFVSAGRPIALKNYTSLEKVFARIRERYPKIELDRRLLPPDEHHARLASCYAVIIPSLSEMSSNMALDAVRAGKPFIMTDDTGTKERLGECGIFADMRSEEALEAAVTKLLNPEEYEYIRARIREFDFVRSWDDLAGEILEAL